MSALVEFGERLNKNGDYEMTISINDKLIGILDRKPNNEMYTYEEVATNIQEVVKIMSMVIPNS